MGDKPEAERLADAAQRNTLARLAFESVEVRGGRARKRPGRRVSTGAWIRRKRRDSNPREVHGEPLPASHLSLAPSVPRGRIAPRRRRGAKLDPGDLSTPGLPASLGGKAQALGASHEAVRQALIAAGLPTGLEDRNARIRAMAEQGVPWAAIARAVGMTPTVVRYVCRDMPPRKGGRPRRRPERG